MKVKSIIFEMPKESRDQFEKLNEALEEMDMPFHSAEQLINSQIDEVLEKYETCKKTNTR